MKKLLAVIITLALIITAVPLTFAAAEESGEVLIVADGVTYKVKQGDTFNYVYYLNTGEKLCSLQAEFFYDAEGLELIIPENPFDLEESMILYRLALSAVTRMVEPGHMKYNYSNADGMDFNTDDSILIRAQFKVTAAEGTYEIRNVLNTIAGADEHKYLYDGEVVDPLKKAEGGIPALTPYDPTAEPTEAPTDAPT
ncbi:MAG: hypothetical protein IJS27_05020, partial [Ruminococcus sp.]|nr:hypothetical protein [Ruminococcus sp.]